MDNKIILQPIFESMNDLNIYYDCIAVNVEIITLLFYNF